MSSAENMSTFDFARSELIEASRRILDSGKGSDLTITCGGETFQVHKAIICPRSDFFAAACWGNFKESQENCIDLPEDDPNIVRKMLQYLYLLDYNENGEQIWMRLVVDASLYANGEKYGIEGLKMCARKKFTYLLRIAQGIVMKRGNFQLYAQAVELIYTSTLESDRGLRDAITMFSKLRLKQLLKEEGFKELLAHLPDFSYDLLAQEAENEQANEVKLGKGYLPPHLRNK